MKNVTKPKAVSFEDALRNLASRLTGVSVKDLPRTQEAIVQFMAENIPSVTELAEAVTQEVIARLEDAVANTDGEQPANDGDADVTNDGEQSVKGANKNKGKE